MYYSVKCGRLSSVQLGLTPQQKTSYFRVNAEKVKENIQTSEQHTRIDVVEISPEGYQMLANATALGLFSLDQ